MTRKLYVMGVDFSDGRTPTYERHQAWFTTEDNARKWFAALARPSFGPAALIHNGLIVADNRFPSYL